MGGRVQCHSGIYNPTSDAVWLAAFAHAPAKSMLDVGTGTGAVALNHRDIEFINADILDWKTDRTFDLVVSNPPYFHGTPAAHNAHHNADLYAWTRACLRRVRPRGYLAMISDATTIDAIIAAMKPTCGDINIFPLFGAKRTAERVLISGRVGTRGGATLHMGLSMNNDAILRDGLTISDTLSKLGRK